jgi:hypothetical protein
MGESDRALARDRPRPRWSPPVKKFRPSPFVLFEHMFRLPDRFCDWFDRLDRVVDELLTGTPWESAPSWRGDLPEPATRATSPRSAGSGKRVEPAKRAQPPLHRRTLRSRVERRPGTVPAVAGHCLAPVASVGHRTYAEFRTAPAYTERSRLGHH